MSRLRLWGAVPLALLILLLPAMLAAAAVPSPTVEMDLYDFGVTPVGLELDPGSNVTLRVVNKGTSGPHNLYVDVGGALAKTKEQLAVAEAQDITFQVPSSGIIPYYCNLPGHKELGMLGNLTVRGSAPVAAAKGTDVGAIRGLGISFYAYWVGVISFIILFVVLAATFFLLRYGESQHWTDQRDRPSREKAGEKAPSMPGTWLVLGIVVLVFLVAAYQVIRVV